MACSPAPYPCWVVIPFIIMVVVASPFIYTYSLCEKLYNNVTKSTENKSPKLEEPTKTKE